MSGCLPAFSEGEFPVVDWLFLDLNSYFASVDQQDQPRLRGRPVGVVAVKTDSTCCLAASYEAKADGVRAVSPQRHNAGLQNQAIHSQPWRGLALFHWPFGQLLPVQDCGRPLQ